MEEEALARYRAKRDFARTPEPSGDEEAPAGAGRFVVQEHHATSMHWDLRLERDGVLVSWAVPKGIPPDPRVDHLAVHTEDHPLLYLDFEGDIPKGEYGGGRMRVWDRGTYTCQKWEDAEVMVTLAGERARGRYVLIRTGGDQWLLHRQDPAEDPTRERMPATLRPGPMTEGPLPEDPDAWSFEPTLGGHRVVVSSEGGRARVVDGAGDDLTSRLPELRDLGRALGAVSTALEGEVVVTGADGRPDAGALARRLEARGDAAARRLATRSPAAFLAADVVWLEGHDTTPLPFRQRRLLLERLEVAGPAWRTTPSAPGEGTTLLAAATDQGLAGVVARRLDGPRTPENVRHTPVPSSERR
ncbi:MAG TPA: DNA polymerase ligase N-terminal domain-containing protein [Acidimicrobiales bacterium]|nr:DNA polymerase ligase N-terminal domain-containing protein [Acidimicrobiales bacterium]